MPRGHFFMRFLIGIALRLISTSLNAKLIGLLLLIFLVGYLLKTWSQVGKQ